MWHQWNQFSRKEARCGGFLINFKDQWSWWDTESYRGAVEGGQGQDAGHQVRGGRRRSCGWALLTEQPYHLAWLYWEYFEGRKFILYVFRENMPSYLLHYQRLSRRIYPYSVRQLLCKRYGEYWKLIVQVKVEETFKSILLIFSFRLMAGQSTWDSGTQLVRRIMIGSGLSPTHRR